MHSRFSRRSFLGAVAGASGAVCLGRALAGAALAGGGTARRYHVSLNAREIERDPRLISVVRNAGVTDVWLAGFLYGDWFSTPEELAAMARRLEREGLVPHAINVPLGHPGDALGARDGNVPVTPPGSWRMAERPDGSRYSGTSVHPPAVEENAEATRDIAEAGFTEIFLDDDYRVAMSPSVIGGCFCAECRQAFLALHGWGETQWQALLGAVAERRLTTELEAWVEYWCDQLTGMLRTLEAAAPECAIGPMVMYMGAEKAGLRLRDYRFGLFRVGELMFSDAAFASVRSKTNELFSSLFHRRYARPELAYSETTAYPHDALSGANLAAKLNVSLLCDVRNTMYMSGLTPFPIDRWEVLGPAMAANAKIHERIAGHRPRGPMKHYWGKHGRYVGEDEPYSLWLALGVPFEVCDSMPLDGWVFLGDADAAGLRGSRLRGSATPIARSRGLCGEPPWQAVAEHLSDLFAWRRGILPSLGATPYVQEEVPVVLGWYPTVPAVVAWNLAEQPQRVTIMSEGRMVARLHLPALDSAIAEGGAVPRNPS